MKRLECLDGGGWGWTQPRLASGPALDRCRRCSRTGPPRTRGLLPVYMCIYIGNSLYYSSPKTKAKSHQHQHLLCRHVLLVSARARRFSCCFLPSRGSLRTADDSRCPASRRLSETATSDRPRDLPSPRRRPVRGPWLMADAAPSTRNNDSRQKFQVCYSTSIYHFLPQTNPY
jgi:hypothetical protein